MLGTKILEEKQSKYNGYLVVKKTFGMGTYIQSDGLTQTGGIVENIWRQTLKKINAKKLNAKSILILGLGGGTLAKLLRKKYPLAKITGVEIDPLMIELGKKYFDLDRYNINIKIEDVLYSEFLQKYWDLVIVDLYNGCKFPKKFEDTSFLKKLTKSKIVIFNRLYYKEKKKEALEFGEKLKKIYKRVEIYKPIANIMFFCYN